MYVGRIVVVGKIDKPAVAYRVSSRSFPNRVARITPQGVAIQPLDPSEIKRNPYIAYNCIRVSESGVVVSNGSHTDPIYEELESGASPEDALRKVLDEMGYERDQYNTPRIAGIVTEDRGYLGIIRDDGLEVAGFSLKDKTCRVICTYELNRINDVEHPFCGPSAYDAARYVVEGGFFNTLENPICSAAWMDQLAVYNPHE
ncbi:MAG: IMP cyclohydrolase [Armatimonadetes bacterium]|nr:IMP cyclohydrolase [Armatimonadota bacterium]